MDFPPGLWYNGIGQEKGAAYERQAQIPFLADSRRTGAAGRPVFLYPRRVDVILHMPASAADIHDVRFQRIEPVHETLEYFCQGYTLTAEREPELLQEVCDWLYAARLNRPMPGNGGLHDPGVMYILHAQPSDNSAAPTILILEDGRAVVNGVRYRLRQRDMAALHTIYQHLNTIYD